MTIECRIPISPRPAWLNRTKLIAASIREFYPDTIVRAYIGDPDGMSDRNLAAVDAAIGCDDDIIVTWIDQGKFDAWKGTRSEYLATMNERFTADDVIGDHVMIMDADVLCMKRFDELFEVDAVQGVMAHHSPIADHDWRFLFAHTIGRIPVPQYVYSGAGIMCQPGTMGPFYPNSGMVFAPRKRFQQLCAPYQNAINRMRAMLRDTYWFDQLALAIACADSGVPVKALPARFNFPNRPAFDAALPRELADIRFIHAMQTDIVHRDRDFESADAMTGLIVRRGLIGSNELLRGRVGRLFSPPELSCVEDAPWA